jgi:hypothetical protein
MLCVLLTPSCQTRSIAPRASGKEDSSSLTNRSECPEVLCSTAAVPILSRCSALCGACQKNLAFFFLRHAAKEWGKGGTDGRVAGVRGEERRYLIILHLPSRRVGLVRPGQHAQNGRLTSAIMFKLSNFQEKKKLRCLTENNNIQ